jgi:RNA polymerase sigma-70 factor, ECF subfamily
MTVEDPPDTDARLLRAVAGGDEIALRVLYQRHAGWLFARLLRRCNDEDVSCDVLQDTFLAIWSGAARWRDDGEVAAWIWGIGIRRLCPGCAPGHPRVSVPDA